MKQFVALLIIYIISTPVFSLTLEQDAIFVRVVDTGAGLATVTYMPGGYYMIYDAGHWTFKNKTYASLSDVIPAGEEIDLMVLSHSDSDHLGVVPKIFENYAVKKVIRTGLERTTGTWTNANKAINDARVAGTTTVYNLKHDAINFGSTFRYGDTLITFVAGFYQPEPDWDIKGGATGSEFRNAGSIVVRLSFNGKSILYTGDAVGRHLEDPDDALIATERFMVENADAIKIDSDVLLAPHHGADNGSSIAFIKAVSPEYVIFSSGDEYGHPREDTALRYLANNVSIDNMFRTDLGDDERGRPKGGDKEWPHGRIDGNHDHAHDDDIEIIIRPAGEIIVEYRHP